MYCNCIKNHTDRYADAECYSLGLFFFYCLFIFLFFVSLYFRVFLSSVQQAAAPSTQTTSVTVVDAVIERPVPPTTYCLRHRARVAVVGGR